jgi:hypothetical protein
MNKFLIVIGVGLFCLVAMTSCGSDTGPDAIIKLLTADVDYGTVAPLSTWTTVGPVSLQVQKSSDDTTPVPDATVKLYIGGVSIDTTLFPPLLFTNSSFTKPPGGAQVLSLSTDDNGTVNVFPVFTVFDCSGTTGSITGNVYVTAVIGADQQTWNGTFTVDCP